MIQTADKETTLRDGRTVKSFSVRVLDFLSSVWLGLFWAVLLFIYCSIGSGIPTVRQLPFLELTEFEWFNWWPFNTLIILLCTTLILATIRRIPLRLVNLGVWTIHTGIIILCIGSYYYFGTKVEGDAPVFRRRVNISMPGLASSASMLAVPGNATTVTVGPDNWRFQIQSTDTEWPILSDENKGERAYAVNVMVQPPTGEPFVRQLLAGFPQYTEDVIPGKGRAIKSLGRRLIDEKLQLTLDFEPTKYFHVMDTWALFVRPLPSPGVHAGREWVERPVEGLPRYNDRISSRDQVFMDPHYPVPLRPIDLAVPPSGDALNDAEVHISGFLRYARMDRRWNDGGSRLNPVLQLSLVSDQAPPREYELIAFDSQRSLTADGNVQFVWLGDRSQVDALPTDSQALLHIAVPDTSVSFDLPLTPDKIGGAFVPIDGTDFSYRVLAVHDHLALPGQDRAVSIAAIEVKTPDGAFRRWVADTPELTKDLLGESSDPHAVQSRPPDPRIVMTYRPQSAPLIFAAYPPGPPLAKGGCLGGLHFVFNGPNGRLLARDVKDGDLIEILPGLSLRIDGFSANAVAEMKPYIVPPPQRQDKVGQTFAMARIEVQTKNGVESKWVPFNQYVFPDDEYGYAGKFAYTPAEFKAGDGSTVEVVLSRKRLPLPNPIAMEDFQLDTHLGGFTGSVSTIRNYVSRLRFLDNGRWTEPVPIAVNQPTEYGGYWYFQSTWDRPNSGESPGGGMNFTGLGIGNRHGVYVQLAGCCIAVAGMIFAFYVKPVLKRRRAEQPRAKISRLGASQTDETTDDEEVVAVEV